MRNSLVALLFVISLVACKKENPEINLPEPKGKGTTPFFFLQSVDGALVLSSVTQNYIYSDATIGDSTDNDTTLVGVNEGAYSVFPGDTPSTFVDAGIITFNDFQMVQHSNFFYERDSKFPDSLNIDFNVPVSCSWNISGSGLVTPFTHTGNEQLPSAFGFNLDTTIHASFGYTITLNNTVQNADTLVYIIEDVNDNTNNITKRYPATVLSATFNSTELLGLNTNRVAIVVAAFNYVPHIKGAMLIGVANQRVVTNDFVVLEP